MAFGYEYLMVYLPEFNPESFLLFVHNPAGSSKLRDYSGGREKVVGQPPLSMVRNATVCGGPGCSDSFRRFLSRRTVFGLGCQRFWQAVEVDRVGDVAIVPVLVDRQNHFIAF